ncbi:MAG TPA: TonB-dependent receptor [Longimicrobiales bacterium]|nr:TonB-dependent receptor [Longimicrobiales bacterium]
MLGKAATRIASTLAVALLLVVMTVAGGHAQASTGKIQGRVVSSDGQPIASAQVSVEGTNLGNITNDDGFYFINQVPAGLHTIRAQSIGFRTVDVTEQRVLAGQTLTQNFTLEPAAVELAALVVAGERNPLVPRDQVSSRAIVTGEKIDDLPLDNAASIILLQPGVIETNLGFSIRGSREGEEAVYVDGVPVRSMRTGDAASIELPTNALAQVDVTTGGIAARYGNAQAGVINYVTRTGGTAFGGTLSLMTDELGPKDWRTGFNRGELSLGGPIPGVQNLTFFMGGTIEGEKYRPINQDYKDYGLLVASGVDTTIRMPRTSSGGVPGATDSVDVIIPNFIPWENGATSPSRVADEYNLTARLSYGLGRGSKLDFTYYRNRDQNLARNAITHLLNPDAWVGNLTTRNMYTMSGYFLLRQTAEQALALDLRVSHQREFGQAGTVEKSYLESHLNPTFGFNMKAIDFVMDPDDWPVNDSLVAMFRSNLAAEDLFLMVPGRGDLTTRQGVAGVASVLTLNPWGIRNSPGGFANLNTSGIGNAAQTWVTENRWYLSGTADWQMTRFNRVWLGTEVTLGDANARTVWLYQRPGLGAQLVPQAFKPKTIGVFLQDRLDLGDVVLEGGVRMYRYDADGEFPRVPGYVFVLPDSLTRDRSTIVNGQLTTTGDCGGAATAPGRTNSAGQVVCKDNFIPAKVRTIFSPKLAVSFPVTATSTFRLSYGQNAQAPQLINNGGILDDVYNDLASGQANTNTTFGRDVRIPTTTLFEAGYRQVFGGATVVDVAAYSKTNRNGLSYRKIRYEDPNTGRETYINSLSNADYSLARGVDLRFDRRMSEIADLSLNYSFLDARGTGSDPITYTGLIVRRNTNLQLLTGVPVEAPDVLQPLDQSRAHTLAGTFSLNFGGDMFENNRVLQTVLSDFGVYATMRIASGLPYTRLVNDANGQIGPPTRAGLSGNLAEQINASRTPMEKRFDLRLTKGFEVFGRGGRVFADWRNPLNLVNTDQVFMETGTATNSRFQEEFLTELMSAQTLDGNASIADVDLAVGEQNVVNRHMLRRTEERFRIGEADGVFSVAEQRRAYSHLYNLLTGPQTLRESNRSLRLGLEIVF